MNSWRASIKAQLKRLADLELISEDHAIDLYKLHSAKGWSREEPLDRHWPLSEPRMLANAMNLIADSGIRTKADFLSVEFTMSAGDVENLVALPPGWFTSRAADVVQLKQGGGRPVAETGDKGVVLPFGRQ
ncbi:hypothetical protein [Bradyrhizobium brasilense]|uniref:hypothetical protein n=1 Tax=Bradyrhizobium brasilense TaxID=1419277 RepID=UPI001E3D4776|nr:hypothetical protein [Bradyrhizobium brasilense]MCC8972803.1 hypothetical protein [Bradyrhizobium brasilense]